MRLEGNKYFQEKEGRRRMASAGGMGGRFSVLHSMFLS